MSDTLNPSQQKAVDHRGGHLLIIAGPGTGKTHTLTRRAVSLIKELPEDRKILAITFTNKAAEEMRDRLKKAIPDIEDKVTIGTFHKFCLQLLCQHIHLTDLPKDFSIVSEEQLDDLAKQLWPDLKPRERKEKLIGISRWKSIDFNTPMPDDVTLYDRKLRGHALLDFDDLQLETLRFLEANRNILDALQHQYLHIFVDEYQDINAVQHALLKVFVSEKNSITAIGDPNQSIYGFRGSDSRFFTRFGSDFQGAMVLSLCENYRSAKNILSASGQVIAGSRQLHVPELTATIYAKGHLTIYRAPSDKAEAEYVVHQIEKMVGGTSMFSHDSGRVERQENAEHSFGDIAVLYRLNSQRILLQKAFERSGIPYKTSKEKTEDDPVEYLQHAYFAKPEGFSIDPEKISLMTIHSAKGLEFPAVFILGCEEHLLPLDLEGLSSDADEERRLFYVGMTRAKERLYLISAKERMLYGRKLRNGPSRFINDIEDSLKELEKNLRNPKARKSKEKQLSLFQ